MELEIPARLIESHGEDNAEWLAALPKMAAEYAARWDLTVVSEPLNGMASLILPVARRDGTQAMLKLQPVNDESESEALALRTWSRDDVVEVLEDDPATSTILLERLEPRTLNDVPDHTEATRILAELLVRLIAVPAPPEIRRLADVAGAMVEDAPGLIPLLSDPSERALVRRFVAQVTELLPESGDRLLHWDLHYDNVMAAQRQPWRVIDPKPLAGDPGFEILPVLWNRWDELVATGDLTAAIRARFDLMLDITGIDRERALGWTAGRVLQNVLWDTEGGETAIGPVLLAIADALLV